MNYCPNCGSPRLTLRVPAGDNRPRRVCDDCRTIHYENPKIVAGCLPVWEDRVLLCRRAIEPAYARWNIPSGYLENGESVLAGARREVWEEAAARTTNEYLISLYNLEKINQVYLQYVGELVGGTFGVGEESLECALFTQKAIPWEEIAFTSSVFTLNKYFADRQRGRRVLHQASYPATGAD